MGDSDWDFDAVLRRQPPPPPPLYREPARVIAIAAAALLIAGAFLPFAEGHTPYGGGQLLPVSRSGLEGAGDGAILLSFGVIAIAIVLIRAVADSNARAIQAGPMTIGIGGVLIVITAWRSAASEIARWVEGGGDGAIGPGLVLSSVGAATLAAAGIWIALTRRPSRDVDPSNRIAIGRSEIAEATGGTAGGLVGGVTGLVLSLEPFSVVLPWLQVFFALMGILIGVYLGVRIARLVGRLSIAHPRTGG